MIRQRQGESRWNVAGGDFLYGSWIRKKKHKVISSYLCILVLFTIIGFGERISLTKQEKKPFPFVNDCIGNWLNIMLMLCILEELFQFGFGIDDHRGCLKVSYTVIFNRNESMKDASFFICVCFVQCINFSVCSFLQCSL